MDIMATVNKRCQCPKTQDKLYIICIRCSELRNESNQYYSTINKLKQSL